MKKTTKQKILEAGVKLWPNVTFASIEKETGISRPNILYHYPAGTLVDAVAEHAIETGESRVIVQLMASGHAAANKLSPADRIRHFNAI